MPHLYSPSLDRSQQPTYYSEDSELVLSMLLRREQLDGDDVNGDGSDGGRRDDEAAGDRSQDDEDMSRSSEPVNSAPVVEPSDVPPYWSFSTTRPQLAVDDGNHDDTAAASSPSGIDEEAVLLPALLTPSSSAIARRSPHQAPYVHLPPHPASGDQRGAAADSSHHQLYARSSDSMMVEAADEQHGEDDDDDASKGLASGPNALPVSPPRRIRRLPTVHQLLDPASRAGRVVEEESCTMGCPSDRCTCSRRSSPAPAAASSTSTPTASTSASTSSSSPPPSATLKGKRKRDTSYIRKCSYLQPGTVFTGSQSFTTFASAYPSSSSYPTSSTRDYYRRNLHPYSALPRDSSDTLYTASPGVPTRRFLDSALDHLQNLTRHATASLSRPPFSSLAPAATARNTSTVPTASPGAPATSSSIPLSAEESAWSAIEGSAIDPSMQDLLAGNPSYGYTSGDSIARASSTEEWEVQVSISSVDYVRGRVTGIMTALNVPNSSCVPSTPSSVGPSSASLANGLDSANTVTTSFEGEIIDLRNNGLWTRAAPNTDSLTNGLRSDLLSYEEDEDHLCGDEGFEEDEEEDNEWRSYRSGHHSSCTGGPWLSSNHLVDKSTDLEYWSKLEAFKSYGPLAEKEICKIAREGKWPDPAKQAQSITLSRLLGERKNPQDYVLMRWKERDFIDCDARSSGLTISGFYYLCLNRKTGALSGFYFDPLSTPHQKLELEVARTRCPPGSLNSPAGCGTSLQQQQQGGIWFGSYSVV